MNSGELTPLLALSLFTLAGGVVGSFGLSALARSTRGRSFVARWHRWGLTLYYATTLVAIIGGFWWVVTTVIGSLASSEVLDSPLLYLGFGLAVGLPFSLIAVTGVWRAAKSAETGKTASKKRKASRNERLEFARRLGQQLKDYDEESRDLQASLRGDKGTVLFIDGALSREQGERLVAALRADLKDVGFGRVEGDGDRGKWWVRL